MADQGKRIDETLWAKILRELREGLSRRNVARRNRVSLSTVHKAAQALR